MALLALAFALLVATCSGAEVCGDTRDGADKGIVRPPRPLRASDRLNCTWTLRAAPGFRLLVRLDSVQLPSPALRSAALRLSVDGRVSEITRDCVNCLDATLAGETVEVRFVSRYVCCVRTECAAGAPSAVCSTYLERLYSMCTALNKNIPRGRYRHE